MIRRIPAMLFHFCLWCIIHSAGGIAVAEEIIEGREKGSSSEVVKKHNNHAHRGLQRNLGFSNFFDGWTTPWQPYEHTEINAPRVPLLRIAPGFFSREFRLNYIYIQDEHHGEADVSELSIALEIPLTLRTKIDIEPKLLYVDHNDHASTGGFGDTRLALRSMLIENDCLSFSTGSTMNITTGDEDRGLGEGITTMGQELALWTDLGHRISLQALLGVEVPTGGEHKEDSNVDMLFGMAMSKTFDTGEMLYLEGITPFIEVNGRKGYGSEKGSEYRVDLLPGIRWEFCREFFVFQGFEIPLNNTEEFNKRFWFGIIKDF